MRFLATFALFSGLVLLSNNGLLGQEKKDKVKGQLPPNWGKLELTAEQKSEIYKIQSKFKGELKKLKEQEMELRAEEKRQMVKILTPVQKKKLEELAIGSKDKEKAPAKDPKK